VKIFSGTANEPLARAICKSIGCELGKCTVKPFPDGETFVKIEDNVRGEEVFVVQPTPPPTNHNLMELFIMIDALRRASAARITAVLPFYGYARQDRKDQPRVPITAKLVAKLLEVAGTNRMLTMDLHSTQIQGFFDIQADNLFAAPVLLDYIKHMDHRNLMIVSPDVGSTKIGRAFAKRLDCDLAIVDKRRSEKDQIDVMNVIGDVRGRDVIILDDMITTGGTLVKAARAVQEKGANSVMACATHPIFAGDACRLIMESPIREVVVTNTVPFDRFGECPKVKMLDVSGLIAEAIKRIHYNESVSTLFV
jgi:ribose-phosphate pyrophosphokinase